MKHLSSLTTLFACFLLAVYLGVFTGTKINSLILWKKLVNVSETPASTTSAQSTSSPAPLFSTQAVAKTITKAPSVNNAPKVIQAAPSRVPVADIPTPVPSVDVPAPAPSVDTLTPAPTPIPTPDNRCIITVSGGQYDVTIFKTIHSGGDVFACGTDMTAIFLSQHPVSFLQKMAQYKI